MLHLALFDSGGTLGGYKRHAADLGVAHQGSPS